MATSAAALAAEGVAVACMNYRRAPEAKYPVPVIQTGEAYLWLRDNASTYAIDHERFIIAGDSAGAHIAAQFAALQSNAAYAEEMNFSQTVPLDTFKALLLFCGPFDAAKISESSNPVMNFFMGRAAWAYTGDKKWIAHLSGQMTISNHITEDFPPAFITDGNSMSFEEHGRQLADALERKNIRAETYFIPFETEKTAHEYQFVMNTSAGRESFRRALDFILSCI